VDANRSIMLGMPRLFAALVKVAPATFAIAFAAMGGPRIW
jgi:hypothetical protein